MKKVVIYIRVSTSEQAQHGFSIDEQRERLISYCKAMGWEVVSVYVDGGYSGKDMNRPGLQKMISEIKCAEVVLIYKLDRLSRSQKDTLSLIEDVFIKNNVDIVSLQENLDTSTPFGRAAIGILSAFAQLERETIKERAILGRTGRARKGKWVGTARPPIGYDYSVEKQELIVDPYEAEQIRMLFDMYTKGTGLRRIAAYLHSNGYKNKYGSWLNWGNMMHTLRNPVYIGKVTFNGQEYDGNHEAIISLEQFQLTQSLLELRKNAQPYKRKSPFSHLLICADCGSNLFYSMKNTRPKYYCYSRANNPHRMKFAPGCKMRIWDVPVIDKMILDEINLLAIDSANIKKYFKPTSINRPQSKDILEDKINSLDKQINRLLDLYQNDHISAEVLNDRIRNLHEEKGNVEKLLANKKSATKGTRQTIREISSIAKELIKTWDEMDIPKKIEIVSALVSKIVVHHDKIDIYWTFAE